MYNYIGDKMKLLNDLNIVPNNIKVYEQAFIHSSYKNEGHVTEDYERLEFLGDALVDLIVSDYLYNAKHLKEGQMTKLRASFVCENALYEYSNKLGLGEYLKLGKGEEETGGRHKKAILADIFESFVGALYLDQGFDTAKKFVLDIVVPFLDSNADFFKDYKSLLQETIQTTHNILEYRLVNEVGPAHNKTFEYDLLIDGIVFGHGVAGTKKEAEQLAAKDALDKYCK